ncbi:DUF1376 domain-containing protein [Lysobacter sp. 5GHs7-4]|uniref:DUF1376 domain-containing protein n=1 Tax=Lysobacter sp. 5GHs7-4 TaxID=2904253 RepID=UPI001E593295|nr:DUF1376 domain-containing protein [Lysobacter sp. 5GHs7-4]UHQ21913.1 DUF1376 domain-containing protein [Lysobacter sp. 5GHs7-4]
MTDPLVPAAVDLRDFPYMPVEFGRLFASETWVLSSDAEKVAALTLWGRSWMEEPAGSLPSEERMLAHLSGAGKGWKKVREMALRNWVAASDGRLYHPYVCEKALEAWMEKLAQRLSSGAGNAKRWGTEFDASALEAAIVEARAFLSALNPQSRVLGKRKSPGVPSGSNDSPDGNRIGIPSGVPSGSQGKGREEKRSKSKPPIPPSGGLNPGHDETAGDAGDTPAVVPTGKITFGTFVEACRAAGEKAIPKNHSVFDFAESAAIPRLYVRLAWTEFARNYSDSQKKQAGVRGWRLKFENCVRLNWYRLWFFPEEGKCELTTAGVGAKRDFQSQAQAADDDMPEAA